MGIARIETGPVKLAADWIVNSGIQSEEGGFYSWYATDKKDYPYLYSEITGYGMTTLLFLYKIYKDKSYLKKAEKAAAWIINKAMHICGGVMTRLYDDDMPGDIFYSFKGANIFSFDTGMVLYGTAGLYKAAKKKSYLVLLKVLAEFLIEKMQKQDGSFCPIYSAGDQRLIELTDKWSAQSGPFHAKISMGLAEVFKITKDNRYRDAAIRVCRYALSRQKDGGRFITDKISGATNLHPHCYAAEGLFYAGRAFGIEEFTDASKAAASWISDKVSEDGINELYNPHAGTFSNFQRSDILAQALRLCLLFSLNDKVDMLRSKLLEYQYMGEDDSQHGGFLYAKNTNCINSWCTMFAVQALALYEDKNLITKDLLFV